MNILPNASKTISALLMIVFSLCVTAQAEINVSLLPDTTCVTPGQEFTVLLNLDTAGTPFHGYELVLNFDPQFTFVSITEGIMMQEVCYNTWWFHEESDSTVFISHALLCGSNMMSGPGTLCAITFQAPAALITTDLTYEYIEFYDAGNPIEDINASGATVIVRDDCASACCFSDASCQVLSDTDCSTAGGLWIVSSPSCDPNPCEYMDLPDHGSAFEIPTIGVEPNPFTDQTTLTYNQSGSGFLQIEIYDLAGRKVHSLYCGFSRAGSRTVTWNGISDDGQRAAPGVYFCQISIDDQKNTSRIVLLQ